jgi:hypothetical protein
MSLVVIPGAGRVAVGCSDGGIRFFDFGVGPDSVWLPVFTLRTVDRVANMLAASPDGSLLIAWFNGAPSTIWKAPAVSETPVDEAK